MRTLGLALYAEGRTDYYFLLPLLQRLCEDICLREARVDVDVSAVLGLDHPAALNEASREDRITEAARLAVGAWNILFVHADGAGNAAKIFREQVDPALQKLAAEFGRSTAGVPVVPVRETEAWVIVDGDALRSVLGATLSNPEMGLPNSMREAEREQDPKAVLEHACKVATQAGRRRKPVSASRYLNALGEQVSLEKLRGLEAFQRLEKDLRQALTTLNVLR